MNEYKDERRHLNKTPDVLLTPIILTSMRAVFRGNAHPIKFRLNGSNYVLKDGKVNSKRSLFNYSDLKYDDWNVDINFTTVNNGFQIIPRGIKRSIRVGKNISKKTIVTDIHELTISMQVNDLANFSNKLTKRLNKQLEIVNQIEMEEVIEPNEQYVYFTTTVCDRLTIDIKVMIYPKEHFSDVHLSFGEFTIDSCMSRKGDGLFIIYQTYSDRNCDVINSAPLGNREFCILKYNDEHKDSGLGDCWGIIKDKFATENQTIPLSDGFITRRLLYDDELYHQFELKRNNIIHIKFCYTFGVIRHSSSLSKFIKYIRSFINNN
jgi:hypothetical protein